MRAVTLRPGKPGSQRLDEIPEPPEAQGSVLVRALAVGICGTDRELINGLYGEAAPGRERLVLGHESLGRGLEVHVMDRNEARPKPALVRELGAANGHFKLGLTYPEKGLWSNT
jgi:threonine dehydrogenase-like Zn-dependent dehydrogenase